MHTATFAMFLFAVVVLTLILVWILIIGLARSERLTDATRRRRGTHNNYRQTASSAANMSDDSGFSIDLGDWLTVGHSHSHSSDFSSDCGSCDSGGGGDGGGGGGD